jgi:glycosyltransferase involved in cell wall biosynthesis
VRRLVLITQRLDPAHPALAATSTIGRALAGRVDELVVLTLAASGDELPANVRVRTFGRGPKPLRAASLQAALARELSPRPLAVLAHMSPVYAVLAAPLVRPARVPLLLWFTHWRRSRLLELAVRLSDVVLTVEAGSFPLPSPKVRAIGHHIDVDAFPCAGPREGLLAVALGRTSPAKGLATIVEGVRRARERGVDVQLEIRGPSLTAEERAHRAELERLAGDGVEIGDAIPREEVPQLLARAGLLVNNMRAGAADKVVFEACATCLPVLASNPSFVDLLDPELRFDRDDPEGLAARLEWLAGLGAEERAELGRRLRERVVAGHSADHWADAVLAAATR